MGSPRSTQNGEIACYYMGNVNTGEWGLLDEGRSYLPHTLSLDPINFNLHPEPCTMHPNTATP